LNPRAAAGVDVAVTSFRAALAPRRSLVLALACLGATASAADPAATGVAPLDAALQGAATEGSRTPLGQDLLALSSQGQGLAQALSRTTELAISPLLALTALGAWRWLRTDASARAALPFFVQPWCWGPAVALLLLGLFKEVVIARIPGAKKPLDALQLVENKVSGLVASPLAIGALAWALERTLQGVSTQHLTGLVWGTAWAGEAGAAGSPLPEALTWALSILGASAVYGSVWLASHTVEVLTLLSPFGLVDSALKLLRLGLLAAVALLGHWLPTAGAVLCALLAVGALASAGLSWRLLRSGWRALRGLLGWVHRAPRLELEAR
jgi:hypothetical protein